MIPAAQNPQPEQNQSVAVGLLAGSVGVTCVLVAVASFLPRARLWGLNHLAFYPVGVRIAVLLFVAVMFVPRLARPVYAALLSFAGGLVRLHIALYVLIAVLCAGAFAALHAPTGLLGDGVLVAGTVEGLVSQTGATPLEMLRLAACREGYAPGVWVAYYLSGLCAAELGLAPVWGVRLVNCALGGIFMFVALLTLTRSRLAAQTAIWWLLLIGLSPVLVLFCGYVETYPPLILLLFLYTIYGWRTLHGRAAIWQPAVLIALALVAHFQALLVLPSFAYLVLRRVMHRSALMVVAVSTIVGTVVVGVFTPLSRHYLGLSSSEEMYGIFSLPHMADLANELFLLLPIWPFFAVLAWLLVRERLGRQGIAAGFGTPQVTTDASRSTQKPRTGWFTTPPEWQFAISLAGPCLLFWLLFRPDHGVARDWDLFAIAGAALVPLALLGVRRCSGILAAPERVARIVTPAIVLFAVMSAAWIGINASWARSVARYESMLAYDRLHANYVYMNLAMVYWDAGDSRRVEQLLQKSVAEDERPWNLVLLAQHYEEVGRLDTALHLVRKALDQWPTEHRARYRLLRLLDRVGAYDEILQVARAGIELESQDHAFWYYLAEASVILGQIDTAIVAYRQALALEPSPFIRARILAQLELLTAPVSESR